VKSEHAVWVATKVSLGEALVEFPDYAHCVHTKAGQEMGHGLIQWWENGAQVRDELPRAEHRYREDLTSLASRPRSSGVVTAPASDGSAVGLLGQDFRYAKEVHPRATASSIRRGFGGQAMTPTALWVFLSVTVIGGIALGRFVAARRARTKELRVLTESPRAVPLLCRLDGHVYTESETGLRCETCGSQLSRADAPLKHMATAGP